MREAKLPTCLKTLIIGLSLGGAKLSETLPELFLKHKFAENLEAVMLPTYLLKLEFGEPFNQSLVGVGLPRTLQASVAAPEEIQSGREFHQGVEGEVARKLADQEEHAEGNACKKKLRTLTYYYQSLEGFRLPAGMHAFALDCCLHQSLKGAEGQLTFGHEVFGGE